MLAMTMWANEQEKRTLIFTNRILLTEQTRRVFQGEGVLAGVVAASMPQYEYEESPVQIASIQTVLSKRRMDDSYWLDGDLVLVDEVHQVATGESAALLNEYKERGSKVCGITATPLGVSNVCDKLIVAAGTRELQEAGILAYARWFAPCELDTRKLVKGKVDLSLSENDARRTWGPLSGDSLVRTRIVGNILEHYERLHPSKVHTLAFAPGVKESLWAAQHCYGRGIRALHIDGDDFWCDGKVYDRKSADDQFQKFMQEWRDGDIPIVWNRFVMREGIDEPQIECLMLATPVGSYRSFLQMVGRGLRVSEETPHAVKVLDFGGNWWRHGSVNVNVSWDEVFECDDPDTLSKNRIAEHRETGESVGRACPKCGMVHKAKGRFLYCEYCGHEMFKGKASRPIIQADGTLTEVNGEPIKQWKIKSMPGNEKRVEGLYWNAFRKYRPSDTRTHVTFNELFQQFFYKTAVEAGSKTKPAFWKAYYPPRNTPGFPRHPNDWHRLVGEVDQWRLY
jgi:superfamily II DNA or RNA helicase